MNKYFIFQFFSALTFSGAVFSLVTQEIVTGYCLLIVGYGLLRKSDKEKQ